MRINRPLSRAYDGNQLAYSFFSASLGANYVVQQAKSSSHFTPTPSGLSITMPINALSPNDQKDRNKTRQERKSKSDDEEEGGMTMMMMMMMTIGQVVFSAASRLSFPCAPCENVARQS